MTIPPPNDFSSPAEWARAYRQIGLAVIPAQGTKKIPAGTWQEFQNGIPQTVHDKWYGAEGTHVGNYRMGFLTGAASTIGDGYKLLILDLDEKNGISGGATWGYWLDEHEMGREVETWRARSGSGGQHLYFKYPENIEIRNFQGGSKGVDVRSEGGFIMAAPSRHENGKHYEWIVAPWDEIDLADAPDWLLEKVGASMLRGAPNSPGPKHVPEYATDAWGRVIDGRDAKMRDIVWAAVVTLRREHQAVDTEQSERAMMEAYAFYEQRVRPQDPTKSLEDEGRGFTLFYSKWQYALKQWDTKVAEAAKESKGPDILVATPEILVATRNVSIDEYAFRNERDIPTRQWVARNLLLRKNVTTIVAAGGTGKSMFFLALAMHIAAGRDYGTFKVAKPARVAMLTVEEDDDEFDRRAIAAAHHFKITQADVGGRLFKIFIPDPSILVACVNNVMQPTRELAELHKQLARLEIDLFVIDPFVEVWSGNENDNIHVKAAAAEFRRIARDINAACLLLHHVRKGEVAPGDADASRGGSALGNAARLTFTLTKMTKDMAAALGISEEESGGKIRLDRGKGNYTRAADQAYWFGFVNKTLDNCDGMAPGDEVGVLQPWEPPGLMAGVSYEQIDTALFLIQGGLLDDDGRETGTKYTAGYRANSSRWVGIPIMQALGCEEERAKTIASAWLKSGLIKETEFKDENYRTKSGIEVDFSKRPGRVSE